jgi:hypothetical protein
MHPAPADRCITAQRHMKKGSRCHTARRNPDTAALATAVEEPTVISVRPWHHLCGVAHGTVKRAVLVVIVSASFLGCGGDGSPTGPSGSSGVPIILSVPSFGMTISLSVAGQTISTAGTHEIRLSAGTQTINGSFNPTGPVTIPQLAISFIGHPAGGGGVRSGSLRSLTGPVLQTNLCSITYASTEPQSFSIQFEVTTDSNSSCPVPGSF